ncbi:hypothetical protein [Micromonospora sp. NPDC049204]|uniref:hypothetical protein n=1 Tax=Micromonospora sp. NPDC049204 TaxID=3154351 RepID=UPI0033DCB6BC
MAAVGWVWAAVINAAVIALAAAAVVSWKKRTAGGLIDRAGRAMSRQTRSSTARSGGVGNGSGRPNAAGKRGGFAGLLDRLRPGKNGGKGGRSTGSSADRSAGPANGKKRGLLDRLGLGKSDRSHSAGAGKTPGWKSLFGGRQPRSPKGSANQSAKQKRGLLGLLGGKPKGSPTGGANSHTPAKPAGKKHDGFLKKTGRGLLAGFRSQVDGDSKKPAAKTPDKPGAVKDGGKHAAKAPDTKNTPGTEPVRKPSPHPKRDGGSSNTPVEENTMVQHQDDASLQKWGRNLTTVSPAIEDAAKAAAVNDELLTALASSVQKLANQGDTELPASPAIVAEAASIAAALKAIEAEEVPRRLRELAARAEALGSMYRNDHEVDEARLAGERGGRHKEKRADVGAAELDT